MYYSFKIGNIIEVFSIIIALLIEKMVDEPNKFERRLLKVTTGVTIIYLLIDFFTKDAIMRTLHLIQSNQYIIYIIMVIVGCIPPILACKERKDSPSDVKEHYSRDNFLFNISR